MIIPFQILLMTIIFFGSFITMDKKTSSEFRLKTVSLSIAGIVVLIFTFTIF